MRCHRSDISSRQAWIEDVAHMIITGRLIYHSTIVIAIISILYALYTQLPFCIIFFIAPNRFDISHSQYVE